MGTISPCYLPYLCEAEWVFIKYDVQLHIHSVYFMYSVGFVYSG